MEYVVLYGKERGRIVTKLIDADEFIDAESNPSDFFAPGSEDIEEKGVIQVVGDVEFLDLTYISEF